MFTFDEDTVSDLHKDAYGFRPSEYWWAIWSESTDEQKQGTWDDLVDQLSHSQEQERRAEARALERFEQLVAKTQEHGAADRETAIRWIVDSLDLGGYATAEYACYNLGLSYGCANMFDGILPREIA